MESIRMENGKKMEEILKAVGPAGATGAMGFCGLY